MIFTDLLLAILRIVYYSVSMVAPGDADPITSLIASVNAMRSEAQTNETNIRADLKKNADAMTDMQSAMAGFNTTT